MISKLRKKRILFATVNKSNNLGLNWKWELFPDDYYKNDRSLQMKRAKSAKKTKWCPIFYTNVFSSTFNLKNAKAKIKDY
jgi:hypothetical protein